MESKLEEQPERLWSGGVHVTLDCPLDQAWAIQADFGGLSEWNPAVNVCHLVEGNNKEPGCVRYCTGDNSKSWVHERLLEFDEEKHFIKYRMEANRFQFSEGVRGYVAQVQMRDAGDGKTVVDWTYAVEPVATQTYEQLTTFMEGFYLYNLNILQKVANAAFSESQQESTIATPACKLIVGSVDVDAM